MGWGAAAAIADTALKGAGLAIEATSNKRAYKWGSKMAEDDVRRSQQMALFNQKLQQEMWEKTGPVGQMEQLTKAGLNPGLIYGMGGAGGQTAAASPAQSHPGQMRPDNMGMNIANMANTSKTVAELQILKAQKENIDADTKNKLAEHPNIPKTGANIDADTENKILQSIISKYTGLEAKDTYEQITSPNRGIQAKTYQDELEARQGIAGNIYELWTQGKLHDKSVAEIEQILIQNSKTRQEIKSISKAMDLLEENIKGAKLDNVIKSLEAELQTKTGIDKNSAGWLKILGRLFVTLMGER